MSGSRSITLDGLKTLLASANAAVKVIDIRSAEEYGKLHIPVAENVPEELLEEASLTFDGEATIVCICNKGHERSQNAAALLFNKGFQNAYYLEGGTLGWFAE